MAPRGRDSLNSTEQYNRTEYNFKAVNCYTKSNGSLAATKFGVKQHLSWADSEGDSGSGRPTPWKITRIKIFLEILIRIP